VKKLIVTTAVAAIVGGVAAVPQSANAQTMAPWVCRAASSSEKPNAMMGSTGLTCKQVDMAKVKAAMAKMKAAMAKMGPSAPGMTDLKAGMDSMSSLYGSPAVEKGGNG